MKITCPDCAFSRDVAREDLPPRTVIANCPKCGCRFRLSPTEGILGIVQPGIPPEEYATPPDENDRAESPDHENSQEMRRDAPPDEPPTPHEDDPLPEGAIVVPPGGETSGEGETKRNDGREQKKSAHTGLGISLTSGNPWDEAPGEDGWFASFFQTILNVMFSAPRFFRTIVPAAQVRPLAFFIILCFFVAVCNNVWVSVFRHMVGDSVDPQLADVFSYIAPQGNVFLTLLLQTVFFTLKLYLFAAVFFIVYRFFARTQPSFMLIFQIVAYSIAPCALALVPLAGLLVGVLWSMACMAIGFRQALHLSWVKTLLGFVPVALVYLMSLRFFSTI